MYLNPPSSAPAVRVKVLIVASDPDTCVLLSGLLAREGCYTALVCEISDMGKVLREEAPPHAILIDDSFPIERVEGLVRCIRTHKSWDNVSVIVLSSRDGEEQETMFFDIGVDDYVIKPIKTRALVARVKRRVLSAH